MTLGLNKISTIVQNTARQAFKIQHWANFNKKYGHLVEKQMSTADFKKQTDALYKQQIKDRKTLFILDVFKCKNIYITNVFGKTSHGAIVKAFGLDFLKGKGRIKQVNVVYNPKEKLVESIKEGLDYIAKSAKKGDVVNFSIGEGIPINELNGITPREFTFNKARKIINTLLPDRNSKQYIKDLKSFVRLSDNDVKVCMSSGNDSDMFDFFSLSRFLTKKPDNINIVGGLNQSGKKIKKFSRDARIVTHWERAVGYFEPIIHKYKILGFALNKVKPADVRSVSIKPLQLEDMRVNMSNKFSGLTLEEAIAKLKRINEHNDTEYQFEKMSNGRYKLKYHYMKKDNNSRMYKATEYLSFGVDENNKLMSIALDWLQDFQQYNIDGTSFASPIRASKILLDPK